eukprot:316737-Rhodomonas_salina.2
MWYQADVALVERDGGHSWDVTSGIAGRDLGHSGTLMWMATPHHTAEMFDALKQNQPEPVRDVT